MKQKNIKTKYTYIDLFCGAGGFSEGFSNAGFNNLFSLDVDPHSQKTYNKNFPNHRFVNKDIVNLTKKDITRLLNGKHVDVVIGGPPCQGFSIAGNIGRKFVDDPRNHLFKEFVRVVDLIKPDFFVMENVARLYTHNSGKTREEIMRSFQSIGYKVESRILNSADYGVPQHRKRVIFIGTNNDIEISFPERTIQKEVAVGQILKRFPSLGSGESSKVPNHSAMTHSEQMLNKMRYVEDGGSRVQIPVSLRPTTGDVRKYIRYNSKKPAVTITGDMRKVFHPTQNRALTVRELASLQSFRDNFVFEGPQISQQQQVGNAVPPLMAQAIANKIYELKRNKKK